MRRAIIQYASDADFGAMLDLTRKKHQAYCDRHGIELIYGKGKPSREPVWWRKVELLNEHIEVFDQLMWLDADCIIVAERFNLFDASGFGIAVCECWDSPTVPRHLQCGVIIVTRSETVKDFLRVWNATDTMGLPHPHWGDQAAFIKLMAGRPYRDLLTILPNRFNHQVLHMESRPPIYVEAFHGTKGRLELMRKYLNGSR